MFGKALGSALVQAKAIDGGYIKFFTVKVIPVPVDSIVAHDSAGAIGDTVIPNVDFFPQSATNQGFTIALLKASTKVKVDSARKIIGLTLGKDTLEATSADGAKKSRFTFTVGPVMPKTIAVADTHGVVNGAKVKPLVVWNPTTTTNKAFTLQITAGDTATVAAIRGDSILPKTAAGQVTVRAISTADPTVDTTFKFTVGTVAVQSVVVTNTPITLAIDATATPTLSFTPNNSTNKAYSITIPATLTGNVVLANSGLSVTAKHLDTGAVVVTTTDGLKTANWTVRVIRPPMGGAKTVFSNKCASCHYTGNPYGVPAWINSSGTSFVDSALIVTADNPANIKTRISVTKDMPPTGMTQAEIDAIVLWLDKK
jgi:hypothetical protein